MSEATTTDLYQRAQDVCAAVQLGCETARQTHLELQRTVDKLHETLLALRHQVDLARTSLAERGG